MRFLPLAAALAALLAITAGLRTLESAPQGLSVTHASVGATPATVFRPASAAAAPVVVVAHGFAGSQQLMQPFAITLARNGYVAVTFDFPGHGRNPEPLRGGIADELAMSRELQAALASMVAFARSLPGGDGRIALLGHSMATDIVVRVAQADPGIAATVAVSLFSPAVTATSPRNLLVIDGALEPAMLTDEAARVVGLAAGGPAQPGTTYGQVADGTARRLALSPGVEHIGVLYSPASLHEALDWMNAVFTRQGDGFVDARGRAVGLLFLGVILLAWPLSRLLPVLAAAPLGAGLGWRRLWPIAIAPALLTPLILWKLPTAFLPILLGDYLAAHLAVYGGLTLLGMTLAGVALPKLRDLGRGVAVAILALAAWEIAALGLPIDRYLTSFVPSGGRARLLPAVLAGTLIWFTADEWLTRGAGAARGGYAATKLLFALSLLGAVALNPPRLFFLVIIIPVIAVFLTIHGLFSTWAQRRTGNPLVAAVANAAALAWAITATFPLLGD